MAGLETPLGSYSLQAGRNSPIPARSLGNASTSLLACADRVQTDTFWKIARGRSVILQHYSDEIAQSKPKAAKTMVHATRWLPYGPRVVDDPKKAAYAAAVRRMVAGGLAQRRGEFPQDAEVILLVPLR